MSHAVLVMRRSSHISHRSYPPTLFVLVVSHFSGGERGPRSAYPTPTVGAVLVSNADGRILGRGRSDYRTEAVRACLEDAGLRVTALREWVVSAADAAQRQQIAQSTLYVTLEPSTRRRGTAEPPVTHLVRQSGVPRIVIGCPSAVPEKAMKGAEVLHRAGLDVRVGVCEEECRELIADFAQLATGKLHRMARNHFEQTGRPLGFLHCSVVDSDNLEAFARQGNAFGTQFGGQGNLGFRNFGAYIRLGWRRAENAG